MDFILKNAKVYTSGRFTETDVCISDGVISSFSDCNDIDSAVKIDCSGYFVFPGFTDVHIHFREPGFSYKETIKTGSKAAARGGYTGVGTMPNLNPVPDSLENLKIQLELIEKDACINVWPYGSITENRAGKTLSKMEELLPYVIGYSDDGSGVMDEKLMEEAMLKAKELGSIIAAHCEDVTLLHGGYIHDGEYAKSHGHRGICSESEWGQIKRDIELAKKTGCVYHVCHISTKESVELIRNAKKAGVNITCETGPHYLILCDEDIQEEGRFKMNPPLRSASDRDALIEGLCDGTIDMIATDHAPHSEEEKSLGLEKSQNGIVGIETAFPVLYTGLVKKNVISLEKLVELMSIAPARRFNKGCTGIEVGKPADFTVFDLDKEYDIDPDEFLSMGKSTPFAGDRVFGRCLATFCRGGFSWTEKGTDFEKFAEGE